MQSKRYPFTAIVGQEAMRTALLLNAIDPSIGGVLISGHKGTGKTTAVRGLAALMPPIEAVAGCSYRCDPATPSTWCASCDAQAGAVGVDGTTKEQYGQEAGGQPAVPARAVEVGAVPAPTDPTWSRHEAACASGAIASLAAAAELEAGRYDVALVVGVEQMKSVDSKTGGDFLGTAAWYEREARGVDFPFPKLFGKLGDEYDRRYGLRDEHLARISAINYSNAKLNPNAQTRTWFMNFGA
jgi:energy-coupling factor transporter ATP-binding protein EcfA2